MTRKWPRAIAAAGLTTAALIGLPGLSQAARPNLVVIQTDDQNTATVKARFRGSDGRFQRVMPNTLREIYGAGTEFTNFYATSPLCGPSRMALLTGRYPHGSGLTGNSGNHGGWQGFSLSPSYTANLPVTLQNAGYRTSHIGKFTNGYYDQVNDRVDRTVPPGWDNWFTNAYVIGTRYYGYEVSHNGTAVGPVGSVNYRSNGPGIDSRRCTARLLVKPRGLNCNYLNDVMTRQAVKELKRKRDRPFFMLLDYQAPHGDVKAPAGPQPATRHRGTARRTPLARPANFNEADLADKPQQIQSLAGPRMDQGEITCLTRKYRTYLESLRSVDDGIGAIMATLRRTGKLRNTYVVFLSDNGYFLGGHRFSSGKSLPYEASSRVPFAIRGPGIPARGRAAELASTVDLTRTLLDVTGARAGYETDGRSLSPYWRRPQLTSRRAVGISLDLAPPDAAATISGRATIVEYNGYRVGPYKYIRYHSGNEAELYDLARDPAELENRIDSPEYAAVQSYLEQHLPEVTDCSGAACRAELPPWPAPTAP